MKRLAIILVMLVGWLGICSATSDGSAKDKDKPAVEFKVRSHDFGTIKEADGKVTYDFRFTNTGKAPLVIISASAPCGCTHPEYPEAPVAPGASGVIKVTYNPKGRPGEFHKNVTVRTNAPKNGKVVLKISGVVIPQ